MAQLISPVVAVSRSGNIALYPALAAGIDGRLGLAWYEYSSPYRADRSDVWFSSLKRSTAEWTPPANISAGVSYNNGPALAWSGTHGHWLCAWHSWRPPGAEPFVVGGDITNLWSAEISLTGDATPAQQMLPGTSNTEYAALGTLEHGGWGLLYHDRASATQCLAFSHVPPFVRGTPLPESFAAGSVADFVAADGTLWLIYVARNGGRFLTSRRAAGPWALPRRLDSSSADELTRPRISVERDGTLWIACHSNTWGRRQATLRAHVSEAVVVHLEADGTPGNNCWTCNAITIHGAGFSRTFSFGPDVFTARDGVEPVEEATCLYDAARGHGFDRRPASQLRELGDELTRGLFFDYEPAAFRVDVPAGEYEIEVLYSSWIAPTAGTRIRVDGIVPGAPLVQRQDAIHLMRISVDGTIEQRVLSENQALDESRPSRVVIDEQGVKHLAWTRYGPDRIDVVHASFEW